MVLREDQKELHRSQRKKKQYDIFADDYVQGDSPFKHSDHNVSSTKGLLMNPNTRVVIGSGKRNPNAARKRTGNRKGKGKK